MAATCPPLLAAEEPSRPKWGAERAPDLKTDQPSAERAGRRRHCSSLVTEVLSDAQLPNLIGCC